MVCGDFVFGGQQLYEVKEYTLTQGKANGVKCIDVDLGDLSYTLIADRGLDIYGVKFRGKQIAYLSGLGIMSPAFYNPSPNGWYETFAGGLLTTCGLENSGRPCEFEGVSHGLHGRISHIPAENVNVTKEMREDELFITVSGLVRETRLMGCNYEMHREIVSKVGGSSLILRDRIKNVSDSPQPLMLLYHINFGYPLVSPESELYVDGSVSITPYNEIAQAGVASWNRFAHPEPGIPEHVFSHEIRADDGKGSFTIANKSFSPELRVKVLYSADSLPTLTQWKSLRPGEYATAMEPGNNQVRGIAWEHEHGNLRYLRPGEEEHTFVEFQFS